jgi:hypothetical protein
VQFSIKLFTWALNKKVEIFLKRLSFHELLFLKNQNMCTDISIMFFLNMYALYISFPCFQHPLDKAIPAHLIHYSYLEICLNSTVGVVARLQDV